MDERRRLGRGALAALALMVLGGPSAPADTGAVPSAAGRCRVAAASSGEEPESTECCFTNPAYVGVCVVQPTEKETCGSILGYLNDQRSQGKSYCDSTILRGGWQQVSCREPRSKGTSSGR